MFLMALVFSILRPPLGCDGFFLGGGATRPSCGAGALPYLVAYMKSGIPGRPDRISLLSLPRFVTYHGSPGGSARALARPRETNTWAALTKPAAIGKIYAGVVNLPQPVVKRVGGIGGAMLAAARLQIDVYGHTRR